MVNWFCFTLRAFFSIFGYGLSAVANDYNVGQFTFHCEPPLSKHFLDFKNFNQCFITPLI